MNEQATFRPGDRVRVDLINARIHNEIGTVVQTNRFGYAVKLDGFNFTCSSLEPSELTLLVRMSAPARALLAAWHASDRTLERIDRPNSSNRANINWGRAVRRYCTPDRSIDLTIAVEVK